MLLFALVGIRGRIHWYDLIIIGLGAAIVYPDEVLDWIGARTGKHFTWLHVVALEVITFAALGLFTAWLLPRYSRMPWWWPLTAIMFLTLFRVIISAISRSLGDD